MWFSGAVSYTHKYPCMGVYQYRPSGLCSMTKMRITSDQKAVIEGCMVSVLLPGRDQNSEQLAGRRQPIIWVIWWTEPEGWRTWPAYGSPSDRVQHENLAAPICNPPYKYPPDRWFIDVNNTSGWSENYIHVWLPAGKIWTIFYLINYLSKSMCTFQVKCWRSRERHCQYRLLFYLC